MIDFSQYLGKQVFITCTGFRVSGKLVNYINAEDAGYCGAELVVDTPLERRWFCTKYVEKIELLYADHPVLTINDMYPAPRSDLDIPFYLDKDVNVVCADGIVVTGKLINWTSALDNEPVGESIGIRSSLNHVEILTEDIASIELLPADYVGGDSS